MLRTNYFEFVCMIITEYLQSRQICTWIFRVSPPAQNLPILIPWYLISIRKSVFLVWNFRPNIKSTGYCENAKSSIWCYFELVRKEKHGQHAAIEGSWSDDLIFKMVVANCNKSQNSWLKRQQGSMSNLHIIFTNIA